MRGIAVAIFFFFLAAGTQLASANKIYTPAQLREMVQSEQFPKQGNVTTTAVRRSFAACIVALEEIISSIGPSYPSVAIVNTGIIRTEKIWTNDAAMTVTCSAADEKMIITTAPYL